MPKKKDYIKLRYKNLLLSDDKTSLKFYEKIFIKN